MLKFQNSRPQVFAPTTKCDAGCQPGRQKLDAGQNPGATKIPLPLRAGDEKRECFSVHINAFDESSEGARCNRSHE